MKEYGLEIFTINPDGSGIKNITQNAATDTSPAWSPDGNRIVFSSDRNGNMELYVMDKNGENVRKLTDNPQIMDWGALWHRNGQRIIFISDYDYSPTGTGIYMVSLGGGKPVSLTNTEGRETGPSVFYSY